MTGPDLRGKRILFLVNVDWFFLSHRLPIALAARDAGADILVAAAPTGREAQFEELELEFIPLPLSRQGRNPITEPLALVAIGRVLRRVRADLIHQVAIKPVLYGSLAGSLVAPRTPRLNAIAGLGFAFSDDARARWVGRIVRPLLGGALRAGRSRTIIQNREDLERFVQAGLLPRDRAVLIRGSGVDVARYRPAPPPATPVVMLASRMLWEKGVGELVEAAAIVRRELPEVRFVLAGGPDAGNPTAVPREQLQAWHDAGLVEWLGHRTDMPDVLRQATIVALPTYYPEGLPRVLLEAAAVGRPVVAGDVPGCREFVQHGVNGVLVPPRDAAALASALLELLRDPARAAAMGAAGRAIVERDFREDQVIARTLELYRELLDG